MTEAAGATYELTQTYEGAADGANPYDAEILDFIPRQGPAPAEETDDRPPKVRIELPGVQVGWLVDESIALLKLLGSGQFAGELSLEEQDYASAFASSKDQAGFLENLQGLSVGDPDFEQFAYGLVQKIRSFSQPAERLAVDEIVEVFSGLADNEEPLPWQAAALCAQTDPEAFFPEKGGSTRQAKRVCGRCDVRGDCLNYALAHDETFGIWGGLSERERRRLKRRVL